MASKFEDFTREELIDYINSLRRMLNSEKYGLYFDKKASPEDIVLQCSQNIPILTHESSKDLVYGKNDNLLIEGDNYAALYALSLIYPSGLADIIYIDPPYNTGNNDFVYNDKFVDNDDGYRHTKWLNFMHRRLILAQKILKDNGVIFISIDEHEYSQLKLLCDSIFGDINYITTFIWHNNKKGRQMDKFIKNTCEYVLMYANDIYSLKINNRKVEKSMDEYNFKDEISAYKKGYPLHNGTASFDINNRPNLCYSIYYNLRDNNAILLDEKIRDADGYALSISEEGTKLINEGYVRIVPRMNKKYGTQRVWRWGKEKFLAEYKTELMLIKDEKGYYFYQKDRIDENGLKEQKYTNYIDLDTSRGKAELNKIFNNERAFDFPKCTDLLKQLFMTIDDGESTIVDFFAGSGTTAQAVLELNKADNGHRRFVLCTNNENNIMTNVCYPRIKTVITGVRPDGSQYSDGIRENVRYYRIGFVNQDKFKEQTKYNLMEKCDGLLCIVEDTHDKLDKEINFSTYTNSKRDKCVAIYNNDYNEECFLSMLDKMQIAGLANNIIYYFSQDSNVDPYIEGVALKKISGAIVKPIPAKIYDIYCKNSEEIKSLY